MTRVPVRELPYALEFAKTISESDVYTFAGVIGDFHPIHVNAVYAATQPPGQRIVHGALVTGLMSAAAANWAARERIEILSAGYDRVRFVKPVLFGDTVTVAYAPKGDFRAGDKMDFHVEARNQHNEVVAVAEHRAHVVRRG